MNKLQEWGARLLGLDVKARSTGAASGIAHVSESYDGRPVRVDWSTEKAIKEGLKVSPWVYTAARKVASAFASVPIVVERQAGDKWEADDKHPLALLLARPNAFYSLQDLMEEWVYHQLLSGNALWFKNLSNGAPVELWPIGPDKIKPVPSRLRFLTGYEYKPTPQEKINLPPEAVTHWKFVDPSNPYWGLAPLQAAALAIDTDTSAANWNRAVLQNGGVPPFAIMLDKPLNPQQQRDSQIMLEDQLAGASRARKFLLLGGASKVQPLQMNATELDFITGRRMSRDEIGAVLGVPAVLMNAGEGATYENLKTARIILWEDTVIPLLDDFCRGIMMSFLPHWNATTTHRVRADLSNVPALAYRMAELAGTAKALVDTGFPLNAVNERLGLGFDPVEGGDVAGAFSGVGDPVLKSAPKPRLQRKAEGGLSGDVRDILLRRDAWTTEIRKRVARLLIAQGEAAASAYLSGGSVPLMADDWKALVQATHLAVLEEEGFSAYRAILDELGEEGDFDLGAKRVAGHVSARTAFAVESITETTGSRIAALIVEGELLERSTEEVRDAIMDKFRQWSEGRAMVIARSEVHSAFNASHQLSAEQAKEDLGVTMVKRWRSVHDSRTRDDHVSLDGEEVGIEESFSNGSAFPDEPNCRCVVTYHARRE